MGEAGVFAPDARLELMEGELIEMAPLYARTGIRETWVIDVAAQRLRMFRDPAEGEYGSVRDIAGQRTAAVQALPEVAIFVADLFPG